MNKIVKIIPIALASMLLVGCGEYSNYMGEEVFVLKEYKVVVNSVENDLEYVFVYQNEGDTEKTKMIKPHYVYRKVNLTLTHLETTEAKEKGSMNHKWFGLKEAESDLTPVYTATVDYEWENYYIEPGQAKTIDVYFEVSEGSKDEYNIFEVDLSNGPLNGVNIYLGTR